MPKLLDVIKEKGLTHEQVIALIEDSLKKGKPDSDIEEVAEPEVDEKKTDKPDTKQVIRMTQTPERDAEIVKESEVEEEIPEEVPKLMTEEDIQKRIVLALDEERKHKLKVPSKGKPSKRSIPVVRQGGNKNWYERIV